FCIVVPTDRITLRAETIVDMCNWILAIDSVSGNASSLPTIGFLKPPDKETKKWTDVSPLPSCSLDDNVFFQFTNGQISTSDLVDDSCKQLGFNVEYGQPDIKLSEKDQFIEDAEMDVRLYKEFFFGQEHFNFMGSMQSTEQKSLPTFVSILSPVNHRTARALI